MTVQLPIPLRPDAMSEPVPDGSNLRPFQIVVGILG